MERTHVYDVLFGESGCATSGRLSHSQSNETVVRLQPKHAAGVSNWSVPIYLSDITRC